MATPRSPALTTAYPASPSPHPGLHQTGRPTRRLHLRRKNLALPDGLGLRIL